MQIISDTYKGSVRYLVAQTEGVCSKAIELLVEGDVILDVAFHGGCNGNLKGITALVKGQKISDVKERLSGITCGGKNTSCPDQFAQLLAAVQEK
ncbi:MAG: TIGR03905 family TSCPD domain-containing protein [Bacteroidales bacterium]|nr:TIGR03905 family TSCPD domain-containing protein [Bacteroidales bacterium]